MKKMSYLIFISFILISGCATTIGTGRIGSNEIKESLSRYSFSALGKIDEGKLPKYVLAIIGDAADIKEANVDLGQLLQDKVSKSGRVTIIDRKNIDKIIEEQKLALSGLTKESGVKIGEILGADFLILSNIISSSQQKVDKVVYDALEIKVKVQVKLINVNTSEVFLSMNGEGFTTAKLITDSTGDLITGALDYNNLYAEATTKAIDSVAPKLMKEFPAIGFVLQINEKNIKTDIGRTVGLEENSRIAFIRKGEPNVHPVTDELISYNIDYLGYGVVKTLQKNTCTIELSEEIDMITTNDLAVFIDP